MNKFKVTVWYGNNILTWVAIKSGNIEFDNT